MNELTYEDIKHAAAAIGIDLEESDKQISRDKSWSEKALQGPIPEGGRDNTCTALAGHYLRILPRGEVEQLLTWWGENACDPPFPHNDVLKCINSIARKVDLGEDIEIMTLGEWMTMDLPEIPELINNWCRIGDLTLLVGGGGVGKSSIALPLGIALASGAEDFLGFSIESPERVAYLDLEMGKYEFKIRSETLGAQYPVLAKENFFGASLSSFRMNRDSDKSRLYHLLEKVSPKLLIIDNHARFHGGDENKAAEMMPMVVIPFTEIMEEFEMSIVYIMHTPWGIRDRPRGTVCIFDAASTVIAVTEGGSLPSSRVLHWTKNRPARREKGPERMTSIYDPESFMVEAGEGEDAHDLFEELDFPMEYNKFVDAIQEKLNIKERTAYRRVKDMVNKGTIIADGGIITLPGLEDVDPDTY